MVPSRLQDEIAHLIKVGYNINTVVVDKRVYIIFKDFELPKGLYNSEKTELLVWTTTDYPKANFDCFWVTSELLLANNQAPQSASSIQNLLELKWRMFSIHPYNAKPWDPFEDDLESYLDYINQRLKTGK